MTEPAQHLRDAFNLFPRGNEGPADHHDRQSEIARGLDLGVSRIAAGVPGHDDIDAMIVSIARSPARSNGPRATITSASRSGNGARGGSTSRTR